MGPADTLATAVILVVFGGPLVAALGLVIGDAMQHPQAIARFFKPHIYILLGFAVLLIVGFGIATIQGKSQEYIEAVRLFFRMMAYMFTGKDIGE